MCAYILRGRRNFVSFIFQFEAREKIFLSECKQRSLFATLELGSTQATSKKKTNFTVSVREFLIDMGVFNVITRWSGTFLVK